MPKQRAKRKRGNKYRADRAKPWYRPYLDHTSWAYSYEVSVSLITSREPEWGVELGVAWGWHVDQILLRCPAARVIGVDAYSPETPDSSHRGFDLARHEQVMQDMLELLQPHGARYHFKRDFSVRAANTIPYSSLDWIFIDASHDEKSVAEDLEAWFPKMKRPSLFMGHDYGAPGHDGVKLAVDKFLSRHGLKLAGVDRSVWWVDLQ